MLDNQLASDWYRLASKSSCILLMLATLRCEYMLLLQVPQLHLLVISKILVFLSTSLAHSISYGESWPKLQAIPTVIRAQSKKEWHLRRVSCVSSLTLVHETRVLALPKTSSWASRVNSVVSLFLGMLFLLPNHNLTFIIVYSPYLSLNTLAVDINPFIEHNVGFCRTVQYQRSNGFIYLQKLEWGW